MNAAIKIETYENKYRRRKKKKPNKLIKEIKDIAYFCSFPNKIANFDNTLFSDKKLLILSAKEVNSMFLVTTKQDRYRRIPLKKGLKITKPYSTVEGVLF